MSTDRKKTWLQCQECGTIYRVPYTIDMDKMYVVADCPHCGMVIGLNLGDEEDEIYAFYNVNVDPRPY